MKTKLLTIGLFIILNMFGFHHTAKSQTSFKRIPLQYIAALGDPEATSGKGAELWGHWPIDPGPRGVWLKDYAELKKAGGTAPANWVFDEAEWWLEENGLIMEKPNFPLNPGKYVVTGGRQVTTILTIYPKDQNGVSRWELDKGAKLYDITHLPCRAARYTPATGENSCSPANTDQSAFKVPPGNPMPFVEGCNKQDYAVLFVIGLESGN